MLTRVLAHPVIQLSFTAFAGLGLILCMIPGLIPALSWVSNYAVQLMLLYLVTGVVFLFLKQPNLTFVFFGGCLALCLFLKYSIKNDDIERWRQTVIKHRLPDESSRETTKPPFKIAHFNISSATNVSSAMTAMRSANADLLSIHEVTPQWDEWLRDSLIDLYPYQHSLVDIGLFGMAIFSKYELQKTDTIYYRDIPSLRGLVQIEDEPLHFLSVHTEPAFNTSSHRRLQEHMNSLAALIKEVQMPIVVFGDFNAVSWSSEIQVFRDSAGLLESRTGFMPHASGGMTSFLDTPFDHIFYSRYLHCIGFENLMSKAEAKRLGICGTYQFKSSVPHAKKTAR